MVTDTKHQVYVYAKWCQLSISPRFFSPIWLYAACRALSPAPLFEPDLALGRLSRTKSPPPFIPTNFARGGGDLALYARYTKFGCLHIPELRPSLKIQKNFKNWTIM